MLPTCRFQCLAALLPQLQLHLARADALQAHHSSPQRIWPPSRRLLPSPPRICSELMVHATVNEPERGCADRGVVDSGMGGGEGSRKWSGKRKGERSADGADFFRSPPIMQIDWSTGGALPRWSSGVWQRSAQLSWSRVLLNWPLLQLRALVTVGSICY